MEYTVFWGFERLASGEMAVVALAAEKALTADKTAQILVFDDQAGRVVDIDLGGWRNAGKKEVRSPGRPKLGVTAREVTLLPRHWDWLASQPGGASVALRKQVETASRDPRHARQKARDSAYRFATTIVGNAPGYEEAMRALYAGHREEFRERIEAWPADVRAYLEKLTEDAF
jgi:hypothetical protein